MPEKKTCPETQFARGSIKKVCAFRLKPEEDLFQSVERICKENNITNGVFISAVGSLKKAAYCIPINCKNGSYSYDEPHVREGSFSLTSLSGMICTTEDGSLLPHIHMTLADGKGEAIGGHIVEGCIVSVSVDIVIGEFEGMIMGRRYDAQLDMPVFDPRQG
jgi:predicted DNA-binding protein with PD1-like motif